MKTVYRDFDSEVDSYSESGSINCYIYDYEDNNILEFNWNQDNLGITVKVVQNGKTSFLTFYKNAFERFLEESKKCLT